MKVKKLVWGEYGYTAYFGKFRYYVTHTGDNIHMTCIFEVTIHKENRVIEEWLCTGGFYEAHLSCQEHFNNLILSGLENEDE